MSMLPRIVDARYAGEYRVWLRFADGVTGEVDLADELWGEIFEPLRSLDAFSEVQLDPRTDTICWPNGADFSPTWLLEHLRTTQNKSAAAE
jgi:Protein of unknown function (DUF2442)